MLRLWQPGAIQQTVLLWQRNQEMKEITYNMNSNLIFIA